MPKVGSYAIETKKMISESYIAVTGDIVSSRSASLEAMESLKTKLTKFNKDKKPVVPFSIQAGDEIQGLFSHEGRPIYSLLLLMSDIYPLQVRWGIGLGTITTPFQNTTAEMRGDAFEKSRRALEISQRKRRMFSCLSNDIESEYVNVVLWLISGHMARWNEMTFRRFREYAESGTIYDVAESEGVSVEAVNKHLNRRNIREVLEGVKVIEIVIASKSTL